MHKTTPAILRAQMAAVRGVRHAMNKLMSNCGIHPEYRLGLHRYHLELDAAVSEATMKARRKARARGR